jgi:hypothetical protein
MSTAHTGSERIGHTLWEATMYPLIDFHLVCMKGDAQKATAAQSRIKATCLPNPVRMSPFPIKYTYFLVIQHKPDRAIFS